MKLEDLQKIPNAAQPTAGQGLTLDHNGLLPGTVLAPSPADLSLLQWNNTTKQSQWMSVWQTYTPVWTTTGTAPALGNGTLVGAYEQLGKIVTGRALLTAGSSTTFGTGTWAFSLPVTAAGGETLQVASIGTAVGVDTGVLIYPGITFLNTTTTINVYTGAGAVFTVTVPFAWGNTDTLSFRFTYEAA